MKTTKTISMMLVLALVAGCGGMEETPDDVDSRGYGLSQDTSEALRAVAGVARQLADAAGPSASVQPDGNWTPRPTATAEPMDRPNAEASAEPVEAGDAPGSTKCYALEWDPRALQVTIRFSGCILPNGDALDGAAIAWLAKGPPQAQVGVRFEALSVGSRTLNGEVILSADSNAILGQATLELVDADSGKHLALDGATIEITRQAVTINGMGSFGDAVKTYAVDFRALRWDDLYNCYPTSGSLVLESPPDPTVTLTYVVTPQGPAVDIKIGNWPAFRQQLTCPLAN
jgi:hypothetical protein